MSESRLVGHSSDIRTLDERDLAAMRPAVPKRKRQRLPRREVSDQSLAFFCSNPQCDHGTWSPHEQARHMAQEFWEVARALVRLAPKSSDALKLTGGVILSELTDDECRAGHNDYDQLRRRGPLEQVPIYARVVSTEYLRRLRAGTLGPRLLPDGTPLPARKRIPKDVCGRGVHSLAGENLGVRPDGKRYCRACAREAARARKRTPKARAYQNAYQRRRYQEDPDFRERRKASKKTDRRLEIERSPEYRAKVNARRAQRRREDPEYLARIKEQGRRSRERVAARAASQ